MIYIYCGEPPVYYYYFHQTSDLKNIMMFGSLWLAIGVLVVHICITLLFIQGFFLTKSELSTNSHCSEVPIVSSSILDEIDNELSFGIKQSFKFFDNLSTKNDDDDDIDGCWMMEAQYDKIIIMIVDALRFDFALNKLNTVDSLLSSNPTKNKLFQFISDPPTVTAQRLKGLTTGGLPTFFDLSKSFASDEIETDNILYQFTNDNDLKKRKYKINFMGDDTWNMLFNASVLFEYNAPYPSFDVYDLYTVDNGCKKHLFPSLYNQEMVDNWDILITHFLGIFHCCFVFFFVCARIFRQNTNKRNKMWRLFCICIYVYILFLSFFLQFLFSYMFFVILGVDHVGHRYHMRHPIMQEKLNEMDSIIDNITNWIANKYNENKKEKDYLFMVFGDHGMTPSGDHGGATDDETHAALFIHTTKNLLPISMKQELSKHEISNMQQNNQKNQNNEIEFKYPQISQVSLVSTLSLLTGVPIPYENIGSIIPDLFIEWKNEDNNQETMYNSYLSLLKAVWLNSLQLFEYLQSYSKISNTFTKDELNRLEKLLLNAMNDLNEQIDNDSLKYNNNNNNNNNRAKMIDICQKIYLKFELFLNECYSLCKNKWTTFDLLWMMTAIILAILSIFGLVSIVASYQFNQGIVYCDIALLWLNGLSNITDLFSIGFLFFVIKTWLFGFKLSIFGDLDKLTLFQIFFYALAFHFCFSLIYQYSLNILNKDFFCVKYWQENILKFDNIIAFVVCAVYWQGLFTDTYIRFEPQLVMFLFAFIIVFGYICSNFRNNEFDSKKLSRIRHSNVYLIFGLICMRCIGLGYNMEPDCKYSSCLFIVFCLFVSPLCFDFVCFFRCVAVE